MKLLNLLLFLFLPFLGQSQPGGGGTITIHHIYDQLGNRIDIKNDSSYTIKCFLLEDTTFLTENVFSEVDYWILESRNASNQYFLDSNYNCLQFGGVSPFANYRLCILSETDTMVIDFVKVLGENPHGLNTHIDSLTIQPVYLQYKKEDMHCIPVPYDNCWTVGKASNFTFDKLITHEKRSLEKYNKRREEEWDKIIYPFRN